MFAGFFVSLRQRDFRVRRCWETRLKFRLERMVWQKDRRGVGSRPMPFSERGSRRKRVWEQVRSRLGAGSLTSTEFVLSVSLKCRKPPFPRMCKISNLFFSSTNIKGRVFKIQKNLCTFFFAKQQVAKHAYMINEQSAKRSALKGQPVHNPGQRPGYQRINAYAL